MTVLFRLIGTVRPLCGSAGRTVRIRVSLILVTFLWVIFRRIGSNKFLLLTRITRRIIIIGVSQIRNSPSGHVIKPSRSLRVRQTSRVKRLIFPFSGLTNLFRLIITVSRLTRRRFIVISGN